MISQFFILSPRGDVIIRKDYLGNVPKNSTETFFRNCKFWKGGGGEAPPAFLIDGVTYLHVKDGGVELVATTRDNASPSFVLEFLKRISVIIKDYCGSMSEDAIRKNVVLIYELLDEVVDYGCPQNTSTEILKSFVLNEPTVVAPGRGQLFGLSKGPTGVFKSVLDTQRTDGKRRDEIYVDVVERLACTFTPSGAISSSQIDGSIQVKSYLAGNPPIRIKLNDGLLIARREAGYGAGAFAPGGFNAGDYAADGALVILDDCCFHEVANLDDFDSQRAITLVPPDGEIALMNYRTTQGIRPPYRLFCNVEADQVSDHKAVVHLHLYSDIPHDKAASGLEVEVPLPRYVQRVHADMDPRFQGQQTFDYSEKEHMLRWKFKKLQGGVDTTLKCRLTLERSYGPSLRTEVGPINLRFTIPMYSASRINLKYLQILKKSPNFNPQRWVRYVTTSSSYTFRT